MSFLSGVIEGFYGTPWKNSERKKLFTQLRKIGMNTYMYAPKDDKKHRKRWRTLYNNTESEILKNLIQTCAYDGVEFVYAISPGLDIVFTSQTDVNLLKEKLNQVHSFGCRSFSILFDDIDPELCLADKTHYSSSAEAQAAITNKLFEWFDDMNVVLFCPTEYCDTRAKPDVVSSDYLKTLGSQLNEKVRIFWTGFKVVSNHIGTSSLENLVKVLKRKPVIWDNIHANDYDNRRTFLGPYKGRDLEIYNYTSGVLTNPNCEYELNFIAIESLAIWKNLAVTLYDASKNTDSCIEENNTSMSNNNSISKSDEDSNVESPKRYEPELVLKELCEKWMLLFNQEIQASFSHIGKNTNDLELNSLIVDDTDTKSNPVIGMKETNVKKDRSCENSEEDYSAEEDSDADDPKKKKQKKKDFSVDDLLLLCHFFYLPYEKGERAQGILAQFKWLKTNAIDYKARPIKEKMDKWNSKFIHFSKVCDEISDVHERFNCIKNKKIVQQLHPYVRELEKTIHLLKTYAKFLGSKERQKSKSFLPEDPEAWFFRGGIIGEMERLIPTSNEEFALHKERSPKTQDIRPYFSDDKELVNEFYKSIYPKMTVPNDCPDFLFDSCFGAYIDCPDCQTFVLEFDDEIQAIACGCASAENLYKSFKNEYFMKMKKKYSEHIPSGQLNSLFEKDWSVPSDVIKKYPATIKIDFLPAAENSVTSLVKCIVRSMKLNAHMIKENLKKRKIEQYRDFGFKLLPNTCGDTNSVLFGYEFILK